jgi:phosphonoacetaldehyde hydrolase
MSTPFVQLKAVVFDWAGTTVDHGSLGPVAAMQSVFASAGIDVTADEIRAPMGLHKRDHIRAVLEAKGSAVDAESLYAEFIPRQLDALAEHSRVITGVPEAVERMRRRGLKIGSTTGYNRAMLDRLLELARTQGFVPDCAICPDDVGGGRPAPWMCYQNAMQMRVYPMSAMVKVGDTESDIAEGRNAGAWTIGVARTGNEIGLSESDWNALAADRRVKLLDGARSRLRDAGAHHVIDSVGEMDATLDEIDARLASGERPR